MAASRSPKVVKQAAAATCVVDDNTTFVQADPATFRALVQKLTGAAPADVAAAKLSPKPQQDDAAVVTVAHAPPPPPPPRRPKLQERRRAAPARLELSRPQLAPASSSPTSFYYYHHAHAQHQGHGHIHGLMHSPVSPMDAYVMLAAASPSLSSSSSMTPSPHSSSPSCGGAAVVMISREEEEREEKAIASKGFYLHSPSPRGGDGDRPKLLPLFPVHSPRINELRRA